MDDDTFNFILRAIRHDITKQDTVMRRAITAEEKLAITLRFLKDEFIKFPTTHDEWTKIAGDFYLKWQFPNCLGVLDGKHIAFRPLKKNAPLYFNYKGFHSIVLLGLADAFAKFIFVDVGCNGRISDGGVLQRSNFQYILKQPEKYLPRMKCVGNGRLLPHIFVADIFAFPLTENLITPYAFTTTDECKKSFNCRLSRARQNIKRAFGILSSRFQIFQTTINLHQTKVKEIVICCCVLHNLLITKSRWYMEEINVEENDTSHQTVSTSTNSPNLTTGDAVRKELTEYFNQEGSL